MKISPLDILFSEYIRRRAILRVGGCERCLTSKNDIDKDNGKHFSAYKQLHCAHMFPRRRKQTRWDIDNAAGLCPGCHRYLDDNALDKVQFFVLLLGQKEFDLLYARSCQVGKPDIEAITLYLKAKLEGVSNESC